MDFIYIMQKKPKRKIHSVRFHLHEAREQPRQINGNGSQQKFTSGRGGTLRDDGHILDLDLGGGGHMGVYVQCILSTHVLGLSTLRTSL